MLSSNNYLIPFITYTYQYGGGGSRTNGETTYRAQWGTIRHNTAMGSVVKNCQNSFCSLICSNEIGPGSRDDPDRADCVVESVTRRYVPKVLPRIPGLSQPLWYSEPWRRMRCCPEKTSRRLSYLDPHLQRIESIYAQMSQRHS